MKHSLFCYDHFIGLINKKAFAGFRIRIEQQ